MNQIDEISKQLPNGFHDAILKSIFINYESDEILLSLDICIGIPDDPIEEMRDQYMSGKLEFFGIKFFISEAPEPIVPCQKNEELLINIEGIESLPEKIRSNLPKFNQTDSFAVWIYINNFNCFLFICAQSAKFTFDSHGGKTR